MGGCYILCRRVLSHVSLQETGKGWVELTSEPRTFVVAEEASETFPCTQIGRSAL